MPQKSLVFPLTLTVILVFASIISSPINLEPEQTPGSNTDPHGLKESEIPLTLATMKGWFAENKGQFENQDMKFIYAGSDIAIGFVESGYLIKIVGEENITSIIKIGFEGSNAVFPEGKNAISHRANYFTGEDPALWKTDVSNYEALVYKDLYPGIDLVFSTTKEGLKYDFQVSAQVDPGQISWSYQGADELSIERDGKLNIVTRAGILVEDAPFSYQEVAGLEHEVPSRYQVVDNIVGIRLGTYDLSHPLVIDPLIFSTFVGGGGDERGLSVALDSDNNAYVTGLTSASNFPTTPGCYDDSYSGNTDAFVYKMNYDGSRLLYSTYIGGSDWDSAASLVIDPENCVYITGQTKSENFPTTDGCYDDSLDDSIDVFALKLSHDGSELLYSTYIGGEDNDCGKSITVDDMKNAYVTGDTKSEDFPTTTGAYDETHNGQYDTFVVKLDEDGSKLEYSSFIGGSGAEYTYYDWSGIAVDSSGRVYLTGSTSSSDFPTTSGSHDRTHNGQNDIYVVQLNADGSELLYSTFVGGSASDSGADIALDSANNAYVTGQTKSSDFPTTDDCFDDTLDGSSDAFLLKLSNDGSELLYSSYVGGDDDEIGHGIVVDTEGHAYITGETQSEDFPTTPGCYDDSYNGGYVSIGIGDAFITKVNSDGSNLLYSSYIGGEQHDGGWSIALDSKYNVVVTGKIASSNFPTTPGCYDDEYNKGSGDPLVFRFAINMTEPIAYIESISPNPALDTHTVEFQGSGVDDGNIEIYSWHSDRDGELYNGSSSIFSSADISLGEHVIYLQVKDDSDEWSEKRLGALIVTMRPNATIESINPTTARDDESIYFEGSGTDDGEVVAYAWSSSIDGEFSNGSHTSFSRSGFSGGRHVISLWVKDDLGFWSREVNTTIYIKGTPVAYIDSITPTLALVDHEVSFQGHGTDDDGTIERYVWRSSLDGELYNGTGEEFDHSGLSIGRHTIFFKVQDNESTWSKEVSTQITVTRRPNATIDSISPSPALDTDVVKLAGNGTDDGSIERYVWRSSIDGEFYNGTQAEHDYRELSNGTHSIYLRVRDNHGFWSKEVSTELTVYGAPRARINKVSPSPAPLGEEVVFSGSTHDDGTIERYVWHSDIDGELYNGTDEEEFRYSGLSRGEHTISFRVKDDDDIWSEAVDVFLNVSKKPTASIDSISPSPALDTDSVRFAGNSSDDGVVERYVWSSDLDGEFYNGSLENISYSQLSNGTHTIAFRVQDNHGFWSEEVTTTLEVNGRPWAYLDSISPRYVFQGDSISFKGRAVEDKAVARGVWRSSIDGEFHNGTDLEFEYSGLSLGLHRIYFRVQDDQGAWSHEASQTLRVRDLNPITLYVDWNGSGDFTTITKALGNAIAGDTIHVFDGEYQENIVVNKSVTIIGNGSDATFIKGVWPGDIQEFGIYLVPAVSIEADRVSIRHLNIRGQGYMLNDDPSYLLLSVGVAVVGNDSVISDCAFVGHVTGILGGALEFNGTTGTFGSRVGGRNLTIERNSFSEPAGDPYLYLFFIKTGITLLYMEEATVADNSFSGAGIRMYGAGKDHYIHTIQDNTIDDGVIFYVKNENSQVLVPEEARQVIVVNSNNILFDGLTLSYGLEALYSHHLTIRNCLAEETRMAVLFMKCHNITLSSNEFTETALDAISLFDSRDCKVENNTLQDDGDSGETAIYLYSSNDTLIQGNDLSSWYEGIQLSEDCHGNNLTGNTIYDSGWGIEFRDGGSHNMIHQNHLFDNYYGVDLAGSTHTELRWNDIHDNTKGVYLDSANHTTIENNFIHDNEIGIYVFGFYPCTGLEIHYCDIYDNEDYGLYEGVGDEVGASYNFWGHHTGPDHSGNQDGEGDRIFKDPDYTPWLNLTFTNKRPLATIDSVSPDVALPGDPVSFEGQGFGNGNIVRYVWCSSLNGELYNGSEAGFSSSDLFLGEHVISFLVQDDRGHWSHEEDTMLVITERPVAFLNGITPSPVLVGEKVFFSGSGSDDGEIRRFAWTSDIDGEFHNATTANFSHSHLSLGEHTISLRVQDDHGVWSEVVTVALIVHQRPTAIIQKIAPNPALDTGSVGFTGMGSDDRDVVSYVWRSSLDGEFYNGTESGIVFQGFSNGTHTIYLKVLDDLGAWSEESQDELIIHGKPRAVIHSIFPDPVLDTKTIVLNGTGTDDGTIEVYEWRVMAEDDSEVYKGQTPPTELLPGPYTIFYRVKDNNEIWSDEVNITLVVHTRPTGEITSIQPGLAKENEDVTFKALAADDGDVVLYLWRSSLDGEFYNGPDHEFTSVTLSVGEHTITLRVQDNYGVWSEEVSSELTIHTRPSAEILSISPESTTEGKEITFTGKGTDDGSIHRYVWISSLDGEMANGSEASFKSSKLTQGAHTITLIVQDNNGVWSKETTATVTVAKEEKEEDEFFLFKEIGPLPVVAYLALVVLALGAVGFFLGKQGAGNHGTPETESSQKPEQKSASSPQTQQSLLQAGSSLQTPAPPPPLPAQPQPTVSTTPLQQASPSQQAPAPTWSCAKCGTQVEQRFIFCVECGTKRD